MQYRDKIDNITFPARGFLENGPYDNFITLKTLMQPSNFLKSSEAYLTLQKIKTIGGRASHIFNKDVYYDTLLSSFIDDSKRVPGEDVIKSSFFFQLIWQVVLGKKKY